MKRLMTKILSEKDAARGKIRRFRQEDEGGMIIFSLFMLVLILTLAGMAVDLMRFETTRAKLQGTLDRATLAAADLDQTLPAEEVCADYFAKAGMSEFLDTCVATPGVNFRIVTATASAEMPMFFVDLPRVFMHPFTPGLSSMTVSGASTAEERVTDVEISLVLDVSGSMGGSRIANLRPAAKQFVSTVLANNTNAPQGLITISMIPYSAVVNPGPAIIPHLNINRSQSYSTCPLFDDDLFLTTALDLDATYDHVSHFDPAWTYYDIDEDYNANWATEGRIKYPWCHVGDHNAIVPVSTNESDLHDDIDALEPYGNTAIDMGMKWGVALLDESTNDIIAALAGEEGTNVPAIATTRPEAFAVPDVLKVVVLMTDGSNTQQYDLEDEFKWDMSPLWFNRNSDTEALWQVSNNRTSVQYYGESTSSRWDDWFYWNGYGESTRYQQYPNGFSSRSEYANASPEAPFGGPGTGSRYTNDVYHARWQELFVDHLYYRVNNEYFGRVRSAGKWTSTEYSQTDNAIDYNIVNSGEADDRLSDICAAARAEDIIIYTVAFEAPSGGQNALQDCASSNSHYFDVAGADIVAAFGAIASDIRALKLTQ